jgi:hypothetical protein
VQRAALPFAECAFCFSTQDLFDVATGGLTAQASSAPEGDLSRMLAAAEEDVTPANRYTRVDVCSVCVV